MSSYYEKITATGEVKCIDEEVPFEIPQGWEWVRLNSYSDVRDGTHDTPQYVVSGYPLITSKDFIGGIFDFSKTKYIDERTFIEINKRSNVQIGDILFSMIGGNIGSMILITKENYFDMAIKNVALFKHYIYNDILIKYLYLYLQSQVVSIKKTASGGAQSFVSLNMLRNYLMPIPPLNEQNRIIGKFKSLDFVIQRYEKSYRKLNKLKQELFPKLRKSILQEAIQGKLVPQIAEEGTAQELLKQIKEEKNQLVKEGKLKKSALKDSVIFKGDDNKYYEQIGENCNDITDEIPFDLPYNWCWCRFSNIVSMTIGKTPARGEQTYWINGKCNWVSISDMVDGSSISTTKEKVSDLAVKEVFSAPISEKGSLLMSFKLSIGKTSILDIDAYHNEAIITIRPIIDKEYAMRNYLFKVLPLIANLGESKDAIKGKTMNSKSLSNLLIPLPPLQEQQRIIEQMNILSKQLR